MTSIAYPAERAKSRRAGRPAPVWLMIVGVLALGFVLSFPNVRGVWRNGTFFDSDDAMQLVQVRELLAGQNWFDMTIWRLDPPHGVFMHWSRVIDLPLALMIKGFGFVLPMQMAERLARLVFPLLMQGLLYAAVAWLARLLIGEKAIFAALVLTLLSGAVFGEFQPGRIDHTAPQIVLLMFMLASLVAAIDPAKARYAVLGGALAALSLGISVENLPFIAAMGIAFVALWILRGAEMKAALADFGIGLGLALPLVFVATIGRAHWLDASCDAYSTAYLLPGLGGVAAILALSSVSPRLQTKTSRLVAAAAAGSGILAVILLTRPICFYDPYTGIDPLVRQIWLKNVEEAMPLSRFFRQEPAMATIYMLPAALGLAAVVLAGFRETGIARTRWLVVAVMCAVALGLSLWMIRAIGFLAPIALLGAAWAIIQLYEILAATKWRAAAKLVFVLVLPFSPIGWALVLTQDSQAATREARSACLASAAFAPLAELPPGIVLAPIDAGSHILALTPHGVLAAPYHRNNAGNRAALGAFLADPPAAREILRANRVRYVAICPGLAETAALAARAPDGLAASLLRGETPDWLTALPRDGAYQVFVIRELSKN